MQKSALLLAVLVVVLGPNIYAHATTEAPAQDANLKLKAAQSVTRTAAGETGITYTVHAPAHYDAEAPPRPILITFSPGGNGVGMIEKLQAGVAEAGWLLVGCDKLRNGMGDRELALRMEQEVMDDILKRVPHDPKRIYLGGFSGGGMRAFDLTTRRKEPIAGILSYGGWLGGPDYQDGPYRKGMSVAMLNGLHDKGAGGWMPIDTATLRKRNCRIKHFAFEGGHKVAPPAVTKQAVSWLEQEWKRAASATSPTKKIALDAVYVGDPGERADDFTKFLGEHFRSIRAITPAQCTLDQANRADVLILDSIVRALPEGCTTAMLMIGSNAAMTGERYGSKIDWLCQCLDHEAYHLDLAHPIFKTPLPVEPTLVEKTCPHSKLKIQAWKVQEPQKDPGLVSSRRYFEHADDSEIISGGVNMKGIHGVPLVREAHRLLWGFNAPPSDMTDEARKVFLNALVWIHQFDGSQQRDFAGQKPRTAIKSILDSPYIDESNLMRWFPEDLLTRTKHDKEKIRQHFEGKLPYVHIPTGGGQFRIDEDILRLQTPNNDPASLAKWAAMLDGDDAELAKRLLHRYTGMRIRNKNQWRTWLKENEGKLRFSDQRGYRFEVESKSKQKAKGTPLEGSGLTDIAPVQFERSLLALHDINGIAHQFQGKKITLLIRARVKEGWHFYPPSEDNGTNIPTTIEVELPEGMKFEGDWTDPPSEDGKLHDGATFERTILVGKLPLDLAEIKGSIRFQACTEAKCLLAQSLEFKLPLRVMPK